MSAILQSFTTDQLLNMLSALVLVETLIVVAFYTAQTKRLADLQQKSTLSPSVSIKVITYFLFDGINGEYRIEIIYTNNSVYDVTISEHQDLYWFNIKQEFSQSRTFTIPPKTPLKIITVINDDKTENEMRRLEIKPMKYIWVNHIRSPFYLALRYEAKNEYGNLPMSSPYLYNLMFESDQILDIMPQICNTYDDETREYFDECIKYASYVIESQYPPTI